MLKQFLHIVLFLFSSTVSSSVENDSDLGFNSLVIQAEYFIPDNANDPFEQIEKSNFTTINPSFSLGGDLKVVWVRLVVNNKSNTSLNLFLKNKYAYMANKIELFESIINFSHRYNQYDLSELDKASHIKEEALVYPFFLDKNETKVFYIKSQTTAIQIFNFELKTLDQLLSNSSAEKFLAYFICFLLLAIAIYNLILFLIVKRLDHFLYTLVLANASLGLMYLYGILARDFGFIGEVSHWLVITSMLVPLFLTLFVQSVFDTKLKNTKLHHGLSIVSLLSLIDVGVAIFIDMPLAIFLIPIVFFASFIMMLWLVLFFKEKNHPLIKLFMMAYVIYLVGMSGTMLSFLNLGLPLTPLSFYSSGLGTLLECYLFSYLLHYRIKQLESEVVLQRNEMILLNKKNQMGDMIGAITHQWKQPLTAISSAITMLQFKLDDDTEIKKEELRKPFNNMTNQVQFMSDTMDDFRYFFQPDGQRELVEIATVIDRATTLINDDFLAENVILKMNLNYSQAINSLHNELLHIILNILQNSLDAFTAINGDHKYILITGENSHKEWVITIEDNAGGIDKDVLPLIFDEYYTSKEKSSGSGIGLYLTRFIVENHLNGTVEVENIDQGSRFIIKLKELKN